MNNAELFRKIFGIYAEEFWVYPKDKMLDWLQYDVNDINVGEWIPVSERLPLKPGLYMVTVGAPYKPVRVYEYNPCEGYENENLWKGEDGAYVFNWFVEAWQNLPEPWKGGAE